jgi:hypothetical protein
MYTDNYSKTSRRSAQRAAVSCAYHKGVVLSRVYAVAPWRERLYQHYDLSNVHGMLRRFVHTHRIPTHSCMYDILKRRHMGPSHETALGRIGDYAPHSQEAPLDRTSA